VPDGPTRRQVLAGGGLLGLGGLLGGGATEQVRAQQAAGQVGTSSDPVDVFANDVDAQSVSTDNLNKIRTLRPGEVSDWGTAVSDALSELGTGATILVAPGTYQQSSLPQISQDGVSILALSGSDSPGSTSVTVEATTALGAQVHIKNSGGRVNSPTIEGICFDGMGYATSGIKDEGTNRARYLNITTANHNSHGIYQVANEGGNIDFTRVVNFKARNEPVAWYATSGASGIIADFKSDMCLASNPSQDGFVFEDIRKSHFEDMTVVNHAEQSPRGVVVEHVGNGAASETVENIVLDNVHGEWDVGYGNDVVHVSCEVPGGRTDGVVAKQVTGSPNDGSTLFHIASDADSSGVVQACGIENGDTQLATGGLFADIDSIAADCFAHGNIGPGVTVRSLIRDNGERTLINGRGVNSGDPGAGGQWSGNDELAHSSDATIEDITNSNLYKAKSDGSWSQIGT